MMMSAMTTTTFYFITVYTTVYAKRTLEMSVTDSLLATVFVGLSNFFWLPMGGLLSDKIGRRPVLVGITTLAIFTSYPVLSWLVSDISFSNLLITLAYFSFFFGMYNGTMVATLAEVMPKRVRTVGFSLAFSLAAAIFGGMTQWLVPSLSKIQVMPAHQHSGSCSLQYAVSSQACIYVVVLNRKILTQLLNLQRLALKTTHSLT